MSWSDNFTSVEVCKEFAKLLATDAAECHTETVMVINVRVDTHSFKKLSHQYYELEKEIRAKYPDVSFKFNYESIPDAPDKSQVQ